MVLIGFIWMLIALSGTGLIFAMATAQRAVAPKAAPEIAPEVDTARPVGRWRQVSRD